MCKSTLKNYGDFTNEPYLNRLMTKDVMLMANLTKLNMNEEFAKKKLKHSHKVDIYLGLLLFLWFSL